MATAISDIVVPRVFTPYMAENKPFKQIMLEQSGILTPPTPDVAARFNAGGHKIEVPFWDDLDDTEASIMDDSDNNIAVSKVTAQDMTAIRHRLAKKHGSKTIAGYSATGRGESPMNRVAERVGAYWGRLKERRIIATAQGVIADNAASNASDMIYSVYNDVASPAASNRISYQAINRARLTMGENLDDLRVIAMHSFVYGTLLDDEKIDFKRPSEAPFDVPYYAGMMVLHSEQMPVTSGTNSDRYDCYLFAPGAFMNIDEIPARPTIYGNEGTEITRNTDIGNGGGADYLTTRRFELLHPAGMNWTSSSQAQPHGATLTELTNAANWTRKYLRKNVKFACLQVNV